MMDIKKQIETLEANGQLDTADTMEKLNAVYEAARGLCFGEDWNNGTHAKLHGYKQKLREAVAAVQTTEQNDG